MNPSISFVCCIDSGWLEEQTIRMIQSLRTWGGRFANCPVFAVTARRSVPLRSETLKKLKELNVQYLRFSEPAEYDWFPYLNKPRALLIADPHITTESVCFLDSDLLIIGEPDCLVLQDGEDFLACVTDAIGGSQGDGHPLEPYWQEFCTTLGVDIDALPWVETEIDHQRIRTHWNGGVVVYRRSSNFIASFYKAFVQVLNACISSKVCGIFFTEQVVLAIMVIKEGLSWRNLPLSHNYEISMSIYSEYYDEARFKDARIVHYHDGMGPKFMSQFTELIKQTHPEVAEWLYSIGPIENRSPLLSRLAAKFMESGRKRKWAAYEKTCKCV